MPLSLSLLSLLLLLGLPAPPACCQNRHSVSAEQCFTSIPSLKLHLAWAPTVSSFLSRIFPLCLCFLCLSHPTLNPLSSVRLRPSPDGEHRLLVQLRDGGPGRVPVRRIKGAPHARIGPGNRAEPQNQGKDQNEAADESSALFRPVNVVTMDEEEEEEGFFSSSWSGWECALILRLASNAANVTRLEMSFRVILTAPLLLPSIISSVSLSHECVEAYLPVFIIPLNPQTLISAYIFIVCFFFCLAIFFCFLFLPSCWIKPPETQEEEAAKEEEVEEEGGRETTPNEWLREWGSHVSLFQREAGMGEKPCRGCVALDLLDDCVYVFVHRRNAGSFMALHRAY